MPLPDPHPIVERAREVAPLIHAASDEIEETRRVPEALDAKLEAAGLYQLYLPEAYGGPQADPRSAASAIEEISMADGSTGWVCMIGSVLSRRFAWMDPDAVHAMKDMTGSLRAAGSNRALGRAQREGDGYRVNGRWNFQSGIEHSSWMFGTCVLMDGEEPLRDENGTPRTRAVAVPVRDGEIIDTWHVVGLKGTGSFDFEVDDLYVPAERTVSRLEPPMIESPLYRARFFGIWSHTVHAGCTLGIARGAIDELRDIASGRGSTGSRTLLRDRERVQRMVGEAEAIVRSARAYLFEAVAEAWAASEARSPDPTREIANVRLAIAHAGHESARAVDLVFSAAGTNAAHTANRLERYFRDVHVAVQHAAAAPANYDGAGRVFLGLPSGLPGW
ncbi:MAG: hypothetical protein F4X25_00150 [Chloroflexi bacterium]|nr:hypothetical protein [Chloroflexota bacterium]